MRIKNVLHIQTGYFQLRGKGERAPNVPPSHCDACRRTVSQLDTSEYARSRMVEHATTCELRGKVDSVMRI
jgi:hypothetical protein